MKAYTEKKELEYDHVKYLKMYGGENHIFF